MIEDIHSTRKTLVQCLVLEKSEWDSSRECHLCRTDHTLPTNSEGSETQRTQERDLWPVTPKGQNWSHHRSNGTKAQLSPYLEKTRHRQAQEKREVEVCAPLCALCVSWRTQLSKGEILMALSTPLAQDGPLWFLHTEAINSWHQLCLSQAIVISSLPSPFKGTSEGQII